MENEVRTLAKHERVDRGSARWAIMQLVMGEPVTIQDVKNEYYAMLTNCRIGKFVCVDGTWVVTTVGYDLFTHCGASTRFNRYNGALYNNFPTIGQVVELVGNPVRIKVFEVTKAGSVTGTILGTKAKLSVKYGEYKIVENKIEEEEEDWLDLQGLYSRF